jgi:hypothetical protein
MPDARLRHLEAGERQSLRDRQTETDRQTDRQTDRVAAAAGMDLEESQNEGMDECRVDLEKAADDRPAPQRER